MVRKTATHHEPKEHHAKKHHARHHLTHAEHVKGGEHSHAHHKKMHDHHMGEAKKHASHLHKMAKDGLKQHMAAEAKMARKSK